LLNFFDVSREEEEEEEKKEENELTHFSLQFKFKE